jgi:hypothetical protein
MLVLLRRKGAPSPLQGEGWDGGRVVETPRRYLERTTPTLTLPLQGGGNRTDLLLTQ